jgi:hypothetical protein
MARRHGHRREDAHRRNPALPGPTVRGAAPDQYHHELAGQELEITGAPPGVYYMLSIANPEARYLETTTENNTAWSSFRITRDSQGNAKITEISHSPCSGTLCGEDVPSR